MEKGSGTRSGLLWEVERILDECNGNLPQVLLMENVPQVIGKKNIKHFQAWRSKLESLGYSNYVQLLNSRNYGIPQNRNRCFMVSILGDYYYEFPKKQKLKLKLKDMLEKDVDEKYYLSDKMYEFILRERENWRGTDKAIINKSVAGAITTREVCTSADSSTYIEDSLEENSDLRKYINEYQSGLVQPEDRDYKEHGKKRKEHIEFKNDNCSHALRTSVIPVISIPKGETITNDEDNLDIRKLQIKEATKKGYAEAKGGGRCIYQQTPSKKRCSSKRYDPNDKNKLR